jgi:prepilin-type N-terminal cleavage/methylation domain-containing protein
MRATLPSRLSRPQAGFTLIEMVVTTMIFLIVLYGVYVIYDAGESNYIKGRLKWDAQSQSRVALERLAREIRMAGYNSPTKVGDPLVIATNDTISFHADVGDGNGLRYVTYSLRDCSGTAGTTLYRNTSTTTYCGGDPFIEGVTSLKFTYYELNNVPIPYPLTTTYQLDSQAPVTGTNIPSVPAVGGQRNSVRQVKLALTVQQTAGTTTIPFTMTTDVALRNLLP